MGPGTGELDPARQTPKLSTLRGEGSSSPGKMAEIDCMECIECMDCIDCIDAWERPEPCLSRDAKRGTAKGACW